MSETSAPVPSDESLFSVSEVEQFSADDVEAGRAIGKMLSALFLYTVVAMLIVIFWTFGSLVTEDAVVANGEDATATEPAHH